MEERGITMVILAMLALSWAFTTYFALPVTTLVILIVLDLVWFVAGWRAGREYENKSGEKSVTKKPG